MIMVMLEHPLPQHSSGFSPAREVSTAGELVMQHPQGWALRKPEVISNQEGRGVESDAKREITAEFHSGEQYSKRDSAAEEAVLPRLARNRSRNMFVAKCLVLRQQHCKLDAQQLLYLEKMNGCSDTDTG